MGREKDVKEFGSGTKIIITDHKYEGEVINGLPNGQGACFDEKETTMLEIGKMEQRMVKEL